MMFCFVLFCFILFYFILFLPILIYVIICKFVSEDLYCNFLVLFCDFHGINVFANYLLCLYLISLWKFVKEKIES